LTLRIGKTTFGETYGPLVVSSFMLEKDVLLLKTEPWLLIKSGFENLLGIVSEVSLGGSDKVRGVGFTENQVGSFGSFATRVMSEGVRAVEDGLEDDFGAFSGGLTSGRTIVVPDREVFNLSDGLGNTHGLGSKVEARTADPDVFGNGGVVLSREAVESGSVLVEAGFH